jgi:tripartite-type tricarboxylate transporter receptor subunit TctC
MPGSRFAQGLAVEPVKMVVPFAAGARPTWCARLLAQKLTEEWGQAVVVENRVGAGGNIGW